MLYIFESALDEVEAVSREAREKLSGLEQVLKSIALQHIILETDSPFLPPVPHRGKRNESAWVLLVAQKLAVVKDTSMEEVANITTQNAKDLFELE